MKPRVQLSTSMNIPCGFIRWRHMCSPRLTNLVMVLPWPPKLATTRGLALFQFLRMYKGNMFRGYSLNISGMDSIAHSGTNWQTKRFTLLIPKLTMDYCTMISAQNRDIWQFSLLFRCCRISRPFPLRAKSGSLTYGMQAHSNGRLDRTQYVHDLLLQKSNGTFYLLIWHEISDVAIYSGGSKLSSTDVELNPASLNTEIKIAIRHRPTATVYKYDGQWQLRPTTVAIRSHSLTVTADDTITVVELDHKN